MPVGVRIRRTGPGCARQRPNFPIRGDTTRRKVTEADPHCSMGVTGSCEARSEGSLLGLRVDRLSALEHFDEGLDLLLPPGFGLHVVDAEGQRETVLLAEVLQHCLCLRLSVDG